MRALRSIYNSMLLLPRNDNDDDTYHAREPVKPREIGVLKKEPIIRKDLNRLILCNVRKYTNSPQTNIIDYYTYG